MTFQQFIASVAKLHEAWENISSGLEPAIGQSLYHNHWFTEEHIRLQINGVKEQFLHPAKVQTWLADYDERSAAPKRVGIICAGNVPLVGLHDLMCVVATGHHAVVKCASKDAYLLPALWHQWTTVAPELSGQVTFVDRLSDVDAVIATGSNNTNRYFEAYFGHLPHLLRKSRTSVAVLTEDFTDYEGLVDDIFLHFGLGCRNVSQLFIPKAASLDPIFEASLKYSHYLQHSKYKNNFIYHTSIFQMNKVAHLTNDFVIMLASDQLFSPLSVVYYQHYEDMEEVRHFIEERSDSIQAVYTDRPIDGWPTSLIGTAQRPQLDDYMDGVDTIQWLINLS